MTRYEPGERFEVTVGSVAHGGHCVVRVDGRVCFVRHAIPGERVVVAVTEDADKRFFRADAVRVLEPSGDRVTPECPVAGYCGGCDFQHVALPAQRELKAEVVREQLRRLGGVDRAVQVEPLAGGRWRTRTRFAVDAEGRPGFRAHRSHRVVPVDDCPITVTECVEPVVGERFAPGGEVAAVRDDRGSVSVVETPPARSGRRGRSRIRDGEATVVQRVHGREFRIGATQFWQVHPAAAETFSDAVADFADAGRGERVWDLYGGSGLFAARLAEAVGTSGSVTVVESSRSAVEHGRANLADLSQVSFVVGNVVDRIEGLPQPDSVVLDPPRKGAGHGVVARVAAAGPRRIVYVACDPAALGRDVALLAEHGYELTALRAFDAFPMTHHVECIALFTR